MRKCPKCKFYNICKGRINETVENCVRFKSTEQTNEEWFCGLDTEDKAREISDMTAQGYWEEELVYKWLKEIHDGSM